MIKKYHVEIEQSILRYCLFNGGEVLNIAEKLRDKDFALAKHQQIFRGLIYIAKQGFDNKDFYLAINKHITDQGSEALLKTTLDIYRGKLWYPIKSEADLNQCIAILLDRSIKARAKYQAEQIAALSDNPLVSAEELAKEIAKLKNIQPKISDEQRLKLEIQNYLLEEDPFKRVNLKNKIQATSHISNNDFLYLARATEALERKPAKSFFSAQEFFDLDFAAQPYIVPGMIPLGDSILFAGDGKVGKSNLVGDLCRAGLEGGEFLGEKIRKIKILYGACDESLRDTQSRFYELGIDLIPDYQDNLAIESNIDIANLRPLEQRISEFKPQLIIIDNLTTIAQNAGVAEKDLEFVHYLFRLNDLAKKYNCTFLILHHQNKDPLAKGHKKIGGNNRIISAPSAIWQISRKDENNEADPYRLLKMTFRNGAFRQLLLSFNSRQLWSSKGIFHYHHEIGDEDGKQKTYGQRVLEMLKTGDYEAIELKELTGLSRSIYSVLDRLERRSEVRKRRSKANPRSWVYSLATWQEEGVDSQLKTDSTNCTNFFTPPPLPISQDSTSFTSERTEDKEIETLQHPVNTLSNRVNIFPNVDSGVELVLNCQDSDISSESAIESTFLENSRGGGADFSTELLTPENISQLEFLSPNYNPGDKIAVRDKKSYFGEMEGYVVEVEGDNLHIHFVGEDRLRLLSMDLVEKSN